MYSSLGHIISLPGRNRDQMFHRMFIVSQLKKDAILGMPFLEKHQCHRFPEVGGGDGWEGTCQVWQALGGKSPSSAGLHGSRGIPGNAFAAESTAKRSQVWEWWRKRTEQSDWQAA